MTRGTGLSGAVVQRSLADWPVVLAAWLLLVCATTLMATGVVYGDAVASGGLHRALLAAPPAARAIDASLSTEPGRIEGLDATIRPEMTRAMGATPGDVVRVVRSGSFADPSVPADEVADLTVFMSVDGLDRRATLVSGAWPQAGRDPLEASVSDVAAAQLELGVGDRIELVSRLDASVTESVVITGIWRVDPTDALFLGEELVTTGTTTGGSYTTRGPLVVREADLLALGTGRGRVEVSWRGIPTVRELRVDGVDALRRGANDLAARLRGVAPTNTRVTTGLPALLDDVGRSVLVSRSGVILLTIQFAVLAGYAVVLVAGMLVERRRAEIALMRSRGASGLHLIVMAVLEAALLAVPAAALAPFLALGVVALLGAVGPTAGLAVTESASIGESALIVSALAGLACIVALTLPTLGVSASPAGARAAQGRQARTTLAQRLGLDLALVAVAGVALWQLRLYGAPLTTNARGTLGLDPLLVAAPAIGLVGGAVLALRVVPRIAELSERLLTRGRGLVGSLGGRQLARRPLRYTRAALLLMLASALGTLAAAHAATWTRSQSDQAAFRAVADVRASASDYSRLPSWAAGPRYRAIPGVIAAVPVATSTVDVGRTIRDGTLAALDREALATISRGSTSGRGDPGRSAAVLATLGDGGFSVPSLPLPGLPARIAVVIDAAFEADPGNGTGEIPAATSGLRLEVVVRDGDGRLFRAAPAEGTLTEPGQRLVLALSDPDAPGLRPTGPLSLEAIELTLSAPDGVAMFGTADLVGLEISGAPDGDADWTPVELPSEASGWRWMSLEANARAQAYTPPAGEPGRVSISPGGPLFGGFGQPGTTFRLYAAPPPDAVLTAVVSPAFLDRTGAAIGDQVGISSRGQQLRLEVTGVIDLLAPWEPAEPLVLVDLADYETVRFAATGRVQQADEWWLSVDPGAEASVLAALRERNAGTDEVIGRAELTRALSTDPVPLGLIGVLGLGSVVAMLFAGVGFLVSSTISTSERIGEFALLRALGLSTGQLSLWLSLESVFLLAVGLAAGSGLGLLLAWLVLPFATLTQTGVPPVPAPEVVVPWEAIVPIYVSAIVLFVLSLWLVRRQLPDIRISGVLRARES